MEHEDNTQLVENFLHNTQNRMESLQMASGAEEIGSEEIGICGKYEEHDDHDEEEWKYIKEVQQSEKQQQHHHPLDFAVSSGGGVIEGKGNDVFVTDNGNLVGDANGVEKDEEMLLLAQQDLNQHAMMMAQNEEGQHGIGNGGEVDSIVVIDSAINSAIANTDAGDNIYDDDVEVIKNDYDFSTNSNTASITGEEDAAAEGIIQVEMKIEEQLPPLATSAGQQMQEDEDEPSSTFGTSSLSENPTPQELEQEQQQQEQPVFGFDSLGGGSFYNKENIDPVSGDAFDNENRRPIDFEIDSHISQLNPNAMEFVPSFGSQPTSPTTQSASFYDQLQNAVPRHLITGGLTVDDDYVVAESPRKGRGSDMDSILLPTANEFEDDIAKRPHELANDILPEQKVKSSEQQFNGNAVNADVADNASPIDHGPETSVDLDGDLALPLSYFKRSENPSIEELLNTVQPLPTDADSLNNSFIEDTEQQLQQQQQQENAPQEFDLDFEADIAGNKELLNVEEKEHISHSPSTEEMHINLQNELHSSAKDIPQIPIDMDSAGHMQDSFYMEHTSSDANAVADPFEHVEEQQLNLLTQIVDQSLLLATNPNEFNDINFLDNSFENAMQSTVPPLQLQFDAPTAIDDISPSPQSSIAEEKHLVEETKEPQLSEAVEAAVDTVQEMEQKLKDMNLSDVGGTLSQIEDVAFNATTLNEQPNPFRIDTEEPAIKPQLETELIVQDEQNLQSYNEHLLLAERAPEQKEQEVHEQPHVPEDIPQPAVETVIEPAVAPVSTEIENKAISEEVEVEASIEIEPERVSEPKPEHEIEHQVEPSNGAAIRSAEPETGEPVISPELEVCKAEPISTPEPEPEQETVLKPELESELETAHEMEALIEIQPKLPAAVTVPEPEPIVHVEPVDVATTPPPTPAESNEAPAVTETEIAATVAAVAASAAAAAVVAGVAAKSPKPTAEIKKPSSATKTTPGAAAKPKIGASTAGAAGKKSMEAPAKKSSTTSNVGAAKPAARPRTAPSAAAAKTATTTAGTARKTVSTVSATTKPVASKSNTTTTATGRPATAPAAKAAAGGAAKTTTFSTRATSSTLTAARKSATASAASTNGTGAAASKTARPSKPTTLAPQTGAGVGAHSAAAKPKVSSPRSTLTSQLRKTAPISTAPTNTAKSPLKSTANGGTFKSSTTTTTTTTTSRTKTAPVGGNNATTTTTNTLTKTFTARPAPKTTASGPTLSATSSRRLTTTNAATTMRRVSPNKPISTTTTTSTSTTATGKLSPTKTSNSSGSGSTLKPKTKETVKVSPTNALKQKKSTTSAAATVASPKSNGQAAVDEQQKLLNELTPAINGDAKVEEQVQHSIVVENGGGGDGDCVQQQKQQQAEVALLNF